MLKPEAQPNHHQAGMEGYLGGLETCENAAAWQTADKW